MRSFFFVLLLLTACRVRAPEPQPNEDPDATISATITSTIALPSPLILGLMPVIDPEKMVARFSPLASYLGRELQTIVELEMTEDYGSMIELARNNGFHLARLSPFAYVAAKRQNPDLKIVVTNIQEGSSTYSGYLVARVDLNVTRVDALRGLPFGFVDPASASGYIYPYAFLLDQGIDPARDFSKVVMVGRHDRLIEHLIEGKIAAGATYSGALLNAEQQGLSTEQIEIIGKTGRIPYDAWVTSAEVPRSLHERLQKILLGLSTRTREGRRVLAPLQSINAFSNTTDAHYDEIRSISKIVMERTGSSRSR